MLGGQVQYMRMLPLLCPLAAVFFLSTVDMRPCVLCGGGGSLVCSWTSSTTSQTSNVSGFHVSVDISNLCVLMVSEGTAGEGRGGGQRHSPVL